MKIQTDTLPIIEGGSSAFDLFQDIGSLGSPDEWFFAGRCVYRCRLGLLR